MRPFGRRRALTCVAALAVASAAALADDPPAGAAKDDKPKVEGDVRTGWRFLSGEGDGRFQEDQGLSNGPRIFDLNLVGTDPRERAPVDEAEMHLSGIGDRDSDYLGAVRKRDVFDLSGGFRRDDSTYTATGDPFSYDTLRERSFVHGRWTPNRSLTVRLSWDRNDRRGGGATEAFSDILPFQLPDSAYDESHPQARRFSQRTDDFTLGADYATGIFRFGLTQSVRFGDVDDSRAIGIESPAGNRLFDDVNLATRSKSWITTAKAGAKLLDGKLDATLFVTRIASPLEARANGNSLVEDANHNTAPDSFSTHSQLRRSDLEWRLETSWRPHPDWEFTAAGELGRLADKETVDLSGAATFAEDRTKNFRIDDLNGRWSLDTTWDAGDGVRLRAGEQYLEQELRSQTDAHFSRLAGTDLTSHSWRTTIGADVEPVKTLSFSVQAHHSSNDAPQTTPVPQTSNDWTLRGRWKPDAELTVTTLWRHFAGTHSSEVLLPAIGQAVTPELGDHQLETTNLGSASRADSWSASAAWTRAPWTVRGTATYRTFDTTADTAFNHAVTFGPAGDELTVQRKLFRTVAFRGRDLVANLEVRREITKTLRVIADGTGTDARGDYVARWLQASLGGEYDLRKDLTFGLTVSAWRLVERRRGADDYRVCGVEASVTYRF